jgi:hypothetical protein
MQDDAPWDGLFAGLFAGVALGIKPSNAPVLVGIALGLLAARRWRSIGWLAAGLAPGVLALAVWKARGEGNLPILHSGASGTQLVLAHAAPVLGLSLHIHQYFHPSWSYFTAQLHDVEQHFWSVRVLEWLAIAGTIGLLRKSRPLGLLFGGWFWSAIVVKWSTPGHGTIADSELLRQTIPAIPAALILIAGILLLFPGVPQKLSSPVPRPWATQRIRVGLATGLVTLFGIAPLALGAGLPRLSNGDTISYYTETGTSLSAPFGVVDELRPGTHRGAGSVRLTWNALHPPGGTMNYQVLRAPAGSEISCGTTGGGAQCALTGAIVSATRTRSFLDKPPPGTWIYRVAAVAGWTNDPTAGNIFVVSPPVTVTVRR